MLNMFRTPTANKLIVYRLLLQLFRGVLNIFDINLLLFLKINLLIVVNNIDIYVKYVKNASNCIIVINQYLTMYTIIIVNGVLNTLNQTFKYIICDNIIIFIKFV